MEQVRKEFVTDEKAKKIALHVSGVSVAGNVLLSLFKLLAGIIGHSGAMISDAVHSASDVFGTIIAVLGISISKRKSDANHQYGHDRLECVAAIVLAVILLATGLGIGQRYRALSHLWQLSFPLCSRSGCIGIPEQQPRRSIPAL